MYLNQTAPQPQKEGKKKGNRQSYACSFLKNLQDKMCKIDYIHGEREKCFKETDSGVYPKWHNF